MLFLLYLLKSVELFPYDVINSAEAREIAEGNEYSFLHVVKPEIDLPENTEKGKYDARLVITDKEGRKRTKHRELTVI